MSVTIKDIARQAEVSYATVSRALNDKYGVNPRTRDKIIKIAEELHYRPNALARSLVSSRSFTIGLVLPDITNPYFPEIAAGIEKASIEQGYGVLLCNTDGDIQREKRYMRLLAERRVEGILLAPAISKTEDMEFQTQNSLPLVYVSNAPLKTSHSAVLIDNIRGGYIATKHLIDCGYGTIGFIGVHEEDMRDNERFEGFRNAIERHGLRMEEKYCRFGTFRQESAYQLIREMISEKDVPRALFVENDNLAIGVLHGIKDSGLKVPDDIAVIGFDDISYSSYSEVQLSTIRQPKDRMGSLAAKMLIEEIESAGKDNNRRTVIVEPELVVRQSSC